MRVLYLRFRKRRTLKKKNHPLRKNERLPSPAKAGPKKCPERTAKHESRLIPTKNWKSSLNRLLLKGRNHKIWKANYRKRPLFCIKRNNLTYSESSESHSSTGRKNSPTPRPRSTRYVRRWKINCLISKRWSSQTVIKLSNLPPNCKRKVPKSQV